MDKFVKCSLWREDSDGEMRKYFETNCFEVSFENISCTETKTLSFSVDYLDGSCDALVNRNPLEGFGTYILIKEYEKRKEICVFESTLEVEYDFDIWFVTLKWRNTRKVAKWTENENLLNKIKRFFWEVFGEKQNP